MVGPEPTIAHSLLRGGTIPKPSLSTIADIEKAMKTVARIPALKERICEYLQSDVSRPRLGQPSTLALLHMFIELYEVIGRGFQPGGRS